MKRLRRLRSLAYWRNTALRYEEQSEGQWEQIYDLKDNCRAEQVVNAWALKRIYQLEKEVAKWRGRYEQEYERNILRKGSCPESEDA